MITDTISFGMIESYSCAAERAQGCIDEGWEPTPAGSHLLAAMIEKFAAAFILSTSEVVEKLEALIKEHCDSGKDQSEAANKKPTTKARHNN
jgi:hypothetical protein